MKIVFRLSLVAAVAACGFWLWTIFFPSPEQVVLGRIASLAATATFSAKDSNIIRAAKAGNLVGYFAGDAQINFNATSQGARTLSGRDEIREVALGGFASLPALRVEFLDATVCFGVDRQTADVSCTARITVGTSKDYGVQEMHFQLQRMDDTWIIARAETVKTLL